MLTGNDLGALAALERLPSPEEIREAEEKLEGYGNDLERHCANLIQQDKASDALTLLIAYQTELHRLEQDKTIWAKLKKKKSSMGGLVFIVFTAVISLFAYVLIGDQSPNANNQKAEIALKNPGFVSNGILLKNNRFAEKTGIFYRLIYGEEKPYDWYPVKVLCVLMKESKLLLITINKNNCS